MNDLVSMHTVLYGQWRWVTGEESTGSLVCILKIVIWLLSKWSLSLNTFIFLNHQDTFQHIHYLYTVDVYLSLITADQSRILSRKPSWGHFKSSTISAHLGQHGWARLLTFTWPLKQITSNQMLAKSLTVQLHILPNFSLVQSHPWSD